MAYIKPEMLGNHQKTQRVEQGLAALKKRIEGRGSRMDGMQRAFPQMPRMPRQPGPYNLSGDIMQLPQRPAPPAPFVNQQGALSAEGADSAPSGGFYGTPQYGPRRDQGINAAEGMMGQGPFGELPEPQHPNMPPGFLGGGQQDQIRPSLIALIQQLLRQQGGGDQPQRPRWEGQMNPNFGRSMHGNRGWQ